MADPTIDAWTRANAGYTDARAEQAWAQDEITWGVWQVPESELRALPDVTGKDVVELDCGTAYFGAWLKKAGAAGVVGVDPTPAQLETARRCNERFGLGLELVEAFGEEVQLPDACFDLVVSEYGASIYRPRTKPGVAGHVHYPPPLSRQHARQHGVGAVQRATHVDLHGVPPLVWVRRRHRPRFAGSAGVIDEQVASWATRWAWRLGRCSR